MDSSLFAQVWFSPFFTNSSCLFYLLLLNLQPLSLPLKPEFLDVGLVYFVNSWLNRWFTLIEILVGSTFVSIWICIKALTVVWISLDQASMFGFFLAPWVVRHVLLKSFLDSKCLAVIQPVYDKWNFSLLHFLSPWRASHMQLVVEPITLSHKNWHN